jgi:hypothetical protein
MMSKSLSYCALSGSRASHRANSSVVSTKGFDPGRAPSHSFLSLTRNPSLEPPARFEPTRKEPHDVVI